MQIMKNIKLKKLVNLTLKLETSCSQKQWDLSPRCHNPQDHNLSTGTHYNQTTYNVSCFGK